MKSLWPIIVFVLLTSCGETIRFSQTAGEAERALGYEKTDIPTLRETGLYVADSFEIAPGITSFTPRFPLYSDTLLKRRFISLPSGTAVDASATETWQFPVGTKIWKEFVLQSEPGSPAQRIETRYMEKAEGRWLFGSYVWNDAQTEASLWTGAAIPAAVTFEIRTPTGVETVEYAIPSFQDCLSCHVQASPQAQNPADPVLGFQAVQLSQVQLTALRASGQLVNLTLSQRAHDIPARNPRERSAIGYLHGNCAHCHNPRRPEVVRPIGGRHFALDYNIATVTTWQDIHLLQLVNRPVVDQNIRIPGVPGRPVVIKPRFPDHSMLFHRMAVLIGPHAMPRIGVASRDYQALNAILRPWIQTLPL